MCSEGSVHAMEKGKENSCRIGLVAKNLPEMESQLLSQFRDHSGSAHSVVGHFQEKCWLRTPSQLPFLHIPAPILSPRSADRGEGRGLK